MLSHFSRIRLFVTLWTVACQAPLSMGFSRQEYWSGLPFPSPGDLPDPGIKPRSPELPADSLPTEPPRKLMLEVESHVFLHLLTWVNRTTRTLWSKKTWESHMPWNGTVGGQVFVFHSGLYHTLVCKQSSSVQPSTAFQVLPTVQNPPLKCLHL